MSAKVNTLTLSSDKSPPLFRGCDSSKTNNRVRREWKNNRVFAAPSYPPRREMFVPADTRLTADHSRRKIAASKGCRLIDMENSHVFGHSCSFLSAYRHARGKFDDNVRNCQLNAIVVRTIKQKHRNHLERPSSQPPWKGSFDCPSQLLWCSILKADSIENFLPRNASALDWTDLWQRRRGWTAKWTVNSGPGKEDCRIV